MSTDELKAKMKTLKIGEAADIVDDLLMSSNKKELTYKEFLEKLVDHEVKRREEKDFQKRLKWAAFPEKKYLDDFDTKFQDSISQKELNQLKELVWLDQVYNLILLGPPGVGKSHLSIGLGLEAIHKGYKVSFVQMDNLIKLLKTEEITRTSRTKVKRIVSSDLVIIDDLMFMAMENVKIPVLAVSLGAVESIISYPATMSHGSVPDDMRKRLGIEDNLIRLSVGLEDVNDLIEDFDTNLIK